MLKALGVVGAIGMSGETAGTMRPKLYPAVRLNFDPAAREALTMGLSGFALDPETRRAGAVWLRARDGRVWSIASVSRDLEFKFEVFTLEAASVEQLRDSIARWTPPTVPDNLPDGLRTALLTRPTMPPLPERFEPWPYRTWTVEVLRRTEWIMPAQRTATGGWTAPPPSKPGLIPPEADAACDVDVGLLLTGSEGRRLLLATGEMPLDVLVSQEATMIDAFVSDCQRVPMN